MRITAESRLRQYAEDHPDARSGLSGFLAVARRGSWQSLQELTRTYPHADAVTVASGRVVTVFNMGGNKYRLITAIHYNTERLFVLRFLSHAEYSRGTWKDSL